MENIWPVIAPRPVTRWLGRAAALVVWALSLWLLFAVIASSLLVLAIFAGLTLCLSLLFGLFAEATLGRLLARAWRLEADETHLTLRTGKDTQRFELSKPYQLDLLRSEGDHKDRGGSVFLHLSQGASSARLLGALGRETLPLEVEAILASTKEETLAALHQSAKDALWLDQEGDVAKLLLVLYKSDPSLASSVTTPPSP